MSVSMVVALVVALGLVFCYTNGFQDGSTVAASAIACRSLTRRQAIVLVAVFELLGALLGGSAVANTLAKVTNWPADLTLLPILASSLAAAITWNYATRILGVPSSSTHALVGGILGAVFAAGGSFQYIVWGQLGGITTATGFTRVVVSLFMSPLMGFAMGYGLLTIAAIFLKRATGALNVYLRRMQWIAVPLLAFGHGANDSQKTMGIITMALYASGMLAVPDVPFWVRLATGAAMVLGVVSLVPRIVQRVGGIYPLRPLHGIVSEASSGLIVFVASVTGGPLSASQVIASTVIGIGTRERKKGVHWIIAKEMVRAWCLTIPSAGIVAWILYTCLFSQFNTLVVTP